MVNLNKIVEGLAKSGVASGLAGGLAGGAITGALTSKQGRKTAKSLLKVGGLAAVGGLAWKAYQSYTQSHHSAEGPVPTQATTVLPGAATAAREVGSADAQRWQHIGREDFEAVVNHETSAGAGALVLVRSMIAAAMADGHLDGGEQNRIFQAIDRLDLTPQEKGLLFDELRHPCRLEEVVELATDPETAIEVYAASLLAIDETRPQGQAYLDRLAGSLRLPPTLVESLHARADLEMGVKAA